MSKPRNASRLTRRTLVDWRDASVPGDGVAGTADDDPGVVAGVSELMIISFRIRLTLKTDEILLVTSTNPLLIIKEL
jgi:hypothetical protein